MEVTVSNARLDSMQEIPIGLLLRCLTIKRLWNVCLSLASYALSWLTKRSVVWGQPSILTVEPTNVCNLECPLCVTGNGRMERKRGLMDFDTFRRTLATAEDNLVYLLLYHQGEPFINRDFLKFVEYAKKRRIFVTTSTNGHYFDRDTAQRTVASGLDSIIISVDGADQATYEKYRVRGSLEKVEVGIKNLVMARSHMQSKTPVIYVQFIVMQHNEQQLDEMAALAKKLGADKFIKKTVQVETAKEAKVWLPKAEAYTRYDLDQGNLKTKRRVKAPCHRPWTSSLVNWDGSVVPCCFDKNSRHELGSVVKEDDFSTIWESERYEGFRAKMLTDRDNLDICSNCSQGLRLFI